mmetsp:Transcript_115305/g.337101  ORF Transcript_115305/g.337101 Transcript_115305/m.337101 type:complete len:247 (-) Transcript_115305:30-770(-)
MGPLSSQPSCCMRTGRSKTPISHAPQFSDSTSAMTAANPPLARAFASLALALDCEDVQSSPVLASSVNVPSCPSGCAAAVIWLLTPCNPAFIFRSDATTRPHRGQRSNARERESCSPGWLGADSAFASLNPPVLIGWACGAPSTSNRLDICIQRRLALSVRTSARAPIAEASCLFNTCQSSPLAGHVLRNHRMPQSPSTSAACHNADFQAGPTIWLGSCGHNHGTARSSLPASGVGKGSAPPLRTW